MKAESTRCAHSGCTNSPLSYAETCWEHTRDKEAYAARIITMLQEGRSLKGANLEKVILKDINVPRADFSGAHLSQADLSHSRLFDANFEGAHLLGAELSDSDLTHCNFRNADLTKANLSDARLWNALLENAVLSEASLFGADLWNSNLHNSRVWHTNFNNAKSLARRNFSQDPSLLWTSKIREDGLMSAKEAYRDLKLYFLTNGIYDDAGWAAFREKTIERFIMKKNRDPRYIPSLVMGALCGYGEKPGRIILSAMLAILVYAFLYYFLNTVESPGLPQYTMNWADYIYYSTVTFTTVGYGDFIPRSNAFFRLLAASEAFIGVFLTGLFIFTLARRYSAR